MSAPPTEEGPGERAAASTAWWWREFVRYVRWATGASQTILPPWLLDPIEKAALGFSYKGIPMLKSPFDLALYSLLLWKQKPQTIIEIGSHEGGSAAWLADQLTNFGIPGEVYSLDLRKVPMAAPAGVTFLRGDARQVEKIFSAAWLSERRRPLLVIDDAAHQHADVKIVLAHFGRQMLRGEYLVVEAGIVSELGIDRAYRGGPLRATSEAIAGGAPFEVDRFYCDFFGRNATWNVDGYLRHV